jgi:hypothetical protein
VGRAGNGSERTALSGSTGERDWRKPTAAAFATHLDSVDEKARFQPARRYRARIGESIRRRSSQHASCSAARRRQEEGMETQDVGLRIFPLVGLMRQIGAAILAADHILEGI